MKILVLSQNKFIATYSTNLLLHIVHQSSTTKTLQKAAAMNMWTVCTKTLTSTKNPQIMLRKPQQLLICDNNQGDQFLTPQAATISR